MKIHLKNLLFKMYVGAASHVHQISFGFDYNNTNLVKSVITARPEVVQEYEIAKRLKKLLEENGASIFASYLFSERVVGRNQKDGTTYTLLDFVAHKFMSPGFWSILAPSDEAMNFIINEKLIPGEDQNPIFDNLLFTHIGTVAQGFFRPLISGSIEFPVITANWKIIKIDDIDTIFETKLNITNIEGFPSKTGPNVYVIDGFLINENIDDDALAKIFKN